MMVGGAESAYYVAAISPSTPKSVAQEVPVEQLIKLESSQAQAKEAVKAIEAGSELIGQSVDVMA